MAHMGTTAPWATEDVRFLAGALARVDGWLDRPLTTIARRCRSDPASGLLAASGSP
jgi:hypothetical protein